MNFKIINMHYHGLFGVRQLAECELVKKLGHQIAKAPNDTKIKWSIKTYINV